MFDRRLGAFAVMAAATLLLAACAAQRTPPRGTQPPPNLTASYAAAAQNGQAVYRLDPNASQVLILAGKTGALAGFGHVHVIVVGALHGFALAAPGGGGRADLVFPLRALAVDPPAARSSLGGEYAKVRLNRGERRATRKHMLGASALNVAHYPWASLAISAPPTVTQDIAITARITLHGVKQNIHAPARYRLSQERLAVAGAFTLRQTRFGIQPYSAFLGALRVKDVLKIRYDLTFRRWCPQHTNPPC